MMHLLSGWPRGSNFFERRSSEGGWLRRCSHEKYGI